MSLFIQRSNYVLTERGVQICMGVGCTNLHGYSCAIKNPQIMEVKLSNSAGQWKQYDDSL